MMKVVQAGPEHNTLLTHFLSSQSLKGAMDIKLMRSDFFAQYGLQSSDFTTYMMMNEQNQIEATASLVIRDAMLMNQPQTLGFACDLRVSSRRRAILNWTEHFLPILEHLREQRNCIVFSAVPQGQRLAYNAFIRPRSVKRKLPRYHLFRRFRLVSLHGKWPFAHDRIKSLSIVPLKDSLEDALIEYLWKKSKDLTLHFYPTRDHVQKELRHWPGLDGSNFFVALDAHGNIRGCVAPWSPNPVQTVLVDRYHTPSRTFKEGLSLLSWLGLTRVLPKQGQPLQFRHLTHLHADNPDIFQNLLLHAYTHSTKKEFLVYTHFENDLISKPPPAFLSATQKVGLFSVLNPNDPVPEFLHPSRMAGTPYFESAWL